MIIFVKHLQGPEDQLMSTPSSSTQSPFMICCKDGKDGQRIYYINTNESLIRVGENPIVGFDILLKMHLCYKIKFSQDLVNFYDFITGCVLRLRTPKGCSIALSTTLANLKLADDKE